MCYFLMLFGMGKKRDSLNLHPVASLFMWKHPVYGGTLADSLGWSHEEGSQDLFLTCFITFVMIQSLWIFLVETEAKDLPGCREILPFCSNWAFNPEHIHRQMTNLTFYSLAFEVNMDLYFIYFPELQTICVEYFPSPLAQYKTTASIVRPSVKVLHVSATQRCQMSRVSSG